VTIRQTLHDGVAAVIPTGWHLVPAGSPVDELSRTTLTMQQQSIAYAEQAPAGVYATSYTLTLISPFKDEVRAELDLDEDVHVLISALDDVPAIQFDRADRVFWRDTNLAYDVHITVATSKE